MNSEVVERTIWRAMKNRCSNKKNKDYKTYGAKGIKVCDEWQNSFEVFYKDMGKRPSSKYSIERVDSTKGYSVDNCRWATMKEQQNNRGNNIVITVNGESKTLAQWCEEKNLVYGTVWARIVRQGLPPIEALNKPTVKTHCKRGHEFTEDNTRFDSRQRVCKICARENITKFKERKLHGSGI